MNPTTVLTTTPKPTPPQHQDGLDDDPWSERKLQEIIRLWELSTADENRLRALHHKLRDIQHPWNSPDVILGFAFSDDDNDNDKDDHDKGFKTTEKRFRKMIQWRNQHRIDDLLTSYQPHPLLLNNSPMAFLKDYDRDGDPIYIERGGAVDVRGLLKRFSKNELMRHCLWLREVQSSGDWTVEYERRQGHAIRTITVVYDLQGLCGRHLQPNVISFFQQFMKLTEDYYPGPIKRMIIIRSPHIFRIGWQTIKHFFSETCREKMIFTGDHDYLSVLDKYMDIDILPPCINPTSGRGTTAVGMPKNMNGGIIPNYIGKGGQGYVPTPDSGISEPAIPSWKEASSICSSTTDNDNEDDDDEEEQVEVTISTGSVNDLTLPVITVTTSSC